MGHTTMFNSFFFFFYYFLNPVKYDDILACLGHITIYYFLKLTPCNDTGNLDFIIFPLPQELKAQQSEPLFLWVAHSCLSRDMELRPCSP